MEKLLGIRDVYMKTVMSSNYQGDIFYTSDQVSQSGLSPLGGSFDSPLQKSGLKGRVLFMAL